MTKGRKSKTDHMGEAQECIRKFCLLDDTFMSKCFEDNIACVQLVLRIVMKRAELYVLDVQTQKEVKNLQGRSIRMDIWAADMEGTVYNIEVERNKKRAIPKRARYNGSVVDANITVAGEHYEQLKKTCIIFITETDVLKGKKPIYHIRRTVKETKKAFGDEAHIIYVNASCQDDTPLGKLMHDFHCTNADDMYYDVLAQRVRYFKETQEGQKEMCEIMEEIERKAEKRGERRGERRGEKRGRRAELRRINSLNQRLREDGRMDDLLKSFSDRAFQKKLFSEYDL